MNNIFLVGLRGSGKTTVGKLLAHHLYRPFIDTDQMIAERQGCSIAEVFHTRGEASFRHMETATLQEVVFFHGGAVVSTGGGIILRAGNRELMRREGLVFHLSAPPEILYQRIAKDADSDSLRPSLNGLTGLEDMRATWHKRELLYEAARHFEIPVENRLPQEVMEAIVAHLPKAIAD
ncbi:MAG TPA: shikimate kinase [Planctomycetota bacterium]|nr:shikimate kinase [Planctomycetota bacterium]